MKLKLTVLLTTCVVAMGLLLSASMAQAEPEVIWDGTNATGIKNLDVDTILYNVAFRYDSAEAIYGSDPMGFDFTDEPSATAAINAVVTALNTGPEGLTTVGPQAHLRFAVGFAEANGLIVQMKMSNNFSTDGWIVEDETIWLLTTNTLTWADFIPLEEPPAEAIPIPRTGQTESYGAGDDGDLEKGAPWPDPRFTDNEDGTVTDNLTGLIWFQNAGAWLAPWESALDWSNSLSDGDVGLSDGSQMGDWRLPNRRELESLIDVGRSHPALPAGHPFNTEQICDYWTSTSTAGFEGQAAYWVEIFFGASGVSDKRANKCAWPVRDPFDD